MNALQIILNYFNRHRSNDKPAADAAFREIFDHFEPRIDGLLRGILHNNEDVQDAKQEVCINVVRYLQVIEHLAFEDDERVTAWLLTIARHTAIDMYRKKNRQLRLVESYVFNSLVPLPADNPLLELISQENMEAALDGLAPSQREIIELTIKGYAPGEIAEKKGVKTSTIYNTRTRARDIIQTNMNNNR